MKKIVGIFVGALLVIILGIIGLTMWNNKTDNDSPSLLDKTQASITDMAINASGLKNTLENYLRDNAGSLSSSLGMSTSEYNQVVDSLAIQDWQAVALPNNVSEADTFSGSYGGVSGVITTYDDPNYVTIEAQGQKVTMEVPPSAQSYLSYLAYLG